jgi:hypothetical protein
MYRYNAKIMDFQSFLHALDKLYAGYDGDIRRVKIEYDFWLRDRMEIDKKLQGFANPKKVPTLSLSP